MEELDNPRSAYAKAASRGFGMGQIEARRFIAEQSEQDLEGLRAALVDDVERSAGVGQQRSVPFGDYVGELVAKGQLEPQDSLEVVYRAGFDVGFRAYLVESLTAVDTYDQSRDDSTALGASDTVRIA
jgi:hypothetical protein